MSNKAKRVFLSIVLMVTFVLTTAESCTTNDGRDCFGASTTCLYEVVTGK